MGINLKTNADIARWTLNGLLLIVSFLVAAIVVLVVSTGLQFVPFREDTAMALLAAFMGGIGLSVILLVLNIAANLSMIAAVKLEQHQHTAPYLAMHSKIGRWFAFAGILVTLGLAVTIGGTVYSKYKFRDIFTAQSHNLIVENEALLKNIGKKLGHIGTAERRDVANAAKVLESKEKNITEVQVIWAQEVMGQKSYSIQGDYFYSSEGNDHPDWFKCETPELCTWFQSFFSGKDVRPYFEFAFMGDEYNAYMPVISDGARYVLWLSKKQSYGKIGS